MLTQSNKIDFNGQHIYAVFYIYLEKNSNCIYSILVFSAHFFIVFRIHLMNNRKKYFINALEEMKK